MTISLTPHGRLAVSPATEAFERGSGHGLLALGADQVGALLPADVAWWRDFGARFVTEVCNRQGSASPPPPADDDLRQLARTAPPMPGAEYLNTAVLKALWGEMGAAFAQELSESRLDAQEFLKRRDPAWNLVGRVVFNLAENRADPDAPFAFLATYTAALSSQSKAQHLPLGQALREYAGAANRERLLSLLMPVQRASETCAWLAEMIAEGDIYHPLRWTPDEALRLLKDVPKLEAAGVVVRMPASWRGNHPAKPRVTGTVGGKAPAGVGTEALLDFQMNVTLEGEALTAAEIKELLARTDGLALVRGRWIELDREQLQKTIDRFQHVQQESESSGLDFREAMRLLAGASIGSEDAVNEEDARAWADVVAGPWLAEVMKGLRSPEGLAQVDPGSDLHGSLRPYQQAGVRWLYLLTRLGLGACLADDMGLGKTVQVLSLLLVRKRADAHAARPNLLVAPASLIANWAAEIEKFAPGLNVLIAHPSAMSAAELKGMEAARLQKIDLVITTYGSVLRLPWMQEIAWRLVVLDEAQAIKNPGTKQTRGVKKLKASSRLALTGTPVENRLSDLWSIFDFVNPGLLGTAKEFGRFTKKLAEQSRGFGPLRELVQPYILRRLKTDKSVISDLPDKTEVKVFCPLSRAQAALYQQSVKELSRQLEVAAGIQRKGLVLSFLMRFKQICNHPSQWLGDGVWSEPDSGKMSRLRDIAEEVASRQEKMLVFTQFRETISPLEAFLAKVFGKPGLVLHGETEVKKRRDLVRRFQEDEGVGFFILSLKAGGAGLNLTAASHVVHFDRWWNPAVENQATDRAFRIGQTKNVLVHKFVCRGTVEDKIDQLIESRRQLSQDLLEGGAEVLLTEMKDDELLRIVTLDLSKAAAESQEQAA